MGKHIGRRGWWPPGARSRHRGPVGAPTSHGLQSRHPSEPSAEPVRINGPVPPGAPQSAPTPPPADPKGTDHRRTRLLPYIIESRDRTVNTVALLVVVGLVILLLVPSARDQVTQHHALWAQLFRAVTANHTITGGIVLTVAGRVVWRVAWRSARNRSEDD
jgi:hypothetical protein